MDLAALESLQLPDAEGGMWRLGDLWVEAPRVLVFARHFG